MNACLKKWLYWEWVKNDSNIEFSNIYFEMVTLYKEYVNRLLC